MARVAAVGAMKSMPRTRAVTPRERKRYVIGDYVVEGAPIGKGGYAFVHKVLSKRGTAYAVKELRHALSQQRDTVRRFQREFEVTAALKHPNIVRMHECFEANGTWNIRMELVEGASLHELARAGEPFAPGLVAALALPLLSALGFAHHNGAVHRDVKPGNVLVSSDGVPKLTDFGIARLDDAQVTRDGMLLGTPAYMSPEQLAGKRGAGIDGRADLYALGAVLYELVCGRNPHGIRAKADIYEVIRIKHEHDPEPLKIEGAEAIEPVLRRAMARDPQDRYPDADSFAAELRPIAVPKRALRQDLDRRIRARASTARSRGARQVAKAPPEEPRTMPWVLKHGPWLAAGLAAALAGTAGWIAASPGGFEALGDRAQRAFENALVPSVERARDAAGATP